MLLNQIIYQMISEGDSGNCVETIPTLSFPFKLLFSPIYFISLGIAIQLSQVIRLLLDPENMALTANVSQLFSFCIKIF